MIVLGVTGAPAAGKSTVCAKLEKLGCPVIDVDRLGHEALDEPAVRARIVALFGDGILGEDGLIDRPALGKCVFSDENAIGRLESIVHPAVRGLLKERLVHAATLAAAGAGPDVAVLECALLFEGGLNQLCDIVLTVHAPRPTRLARAATRNWSDEELARRESRQLSADEKRVRSNAVIDNDEGPEALDAALDALLGHLSTLTPSRPSGGTEGSSL